MKKTLALASGGVAAAALALAGAPVTAHALAGTSDECDNGLQHTGSVKHSFTHSHENCVNSTGRGNTAYLTDSDFNLINMFGKNDTVRDFKNSDSNTINFFKGSNDDTVKANGAFNDVLSFDKGASNDILTLLGSNDNITILGNFDSLVLPAGTTGISCTVSGDHVTGNIVFGKNCI